MFRSSRGMLRCALKIVSAAVIVLGFQRANFAQQTGEEADIALPHLNAATPEESAAIRRRVAVGMTQPSRSVQLMDDDARTSENPLTRLSYIHRKDPMHFLLVRDVSKQSPSSVGLKDETWSKIKETIAKRQQAHNCDRAELQSLLEQKATTTQINHFLQNVLLAEVEREEEAADTFTSVVTGDEREAFAAYLLKLAPMNAIDYHFVAAFLEYDDAQLRRIKAAKAEMRAILLKKEQQAIATRTPIQRPTPDEMFTYQLMVLQHLNPLQLEIFLRNGQGISSKAELADFTSKLSTENATKLRQLLTGISY